MTRAVNRREFLELAGLASAGVAGVVFSSGLQPARAAGAKEFVFLQMSDDGLGFRTVRVKPGASEYTMTEWPVVKG